mmetsp:Transcript_35556/g.88704  ORF Transcript_35556/g.88704 Transcript_35556/m.88704 type:complete len:82 (-) Transcript_35556:366-611(-)
MIPMLAGNQLTPFSLRELTDEELTAFTDEKIVAYRDLVLSRREDLLNPSMLTWHFSDANTADYFKMCKTVKNRSGTSTFAA